MKRDFDIAPEPRGPFETARQAYHHRLPHRYETDLWDRRFRSRIRELLRRDMAILDLGAGRRPTLAPADRPAGTHYVGLDLDASELAMAPPGSYDETVVAPAERFVSELEGGFDLAVSFLAFEHVQSTVRGLENLHRYLRPGGYLLAQLAGSRSPFSLANRLLPGSLTRRLLQRTQARRPDTVFPANYDKCTYSGLTALLSGHWKEQQVTPLFSGAGYVLFSRPLTAAYILYEDWAYRRGHRDLAPYYLVEARK